MATARLRKTFHYPADNSDDDDTPRDLDEEGEANQKLREEDDERNEEYKRIFLAIPTISATSYIPALIMSRLVQVKLISLLSMTSLIATAYILVFVPNTRAEPSEPMKSRRQLATTPEPSPLHKYIGYLNGGLSLLIGLNAISFKDNRGVHEGFWLLCLLPVVSFSIITLARRLMLSVDVGELEELTYIYKGA